jgi:uncharacterized protein (DUF1684 family)
MSEAAFEQYRRQKDGYFKNSPESPLTEAQKPLFDSLNYYDYNPDLDLTLTITRFETDEAIPVYTTRNEIRQYIRYGEFTIDVDGENARLTLYQTPHGFFIPFVDANAGTETYPAGRYIDPESIDDDTFHIDFNRAYSPLCAYNDRWNCPITPAENRLTVAIRAGEKIPSGAWLDNA